MEPVENTRLRFLKCPRASLPSSDAPPKPSTGAACRPVFKSDGAVMTVSAGQNSARPCRGPGAARSFDPGAQARLFWPLELVQCLGLPFPCLGSFPGLCGPFFPLAGLGGVVCLLHCCPVARGLLCDQGRCSLRPSAACLVKKLPLGVVVLNRLLPPAFALLFLIAIEAQTLAPWSARVAQAGNRAAQPRHHGRVERPHGHMLGVGALLAAQQPVGAWPPTRGTRLAGQTARCGCP